ncbi:MAG: DNA methyltransferase, partial [Promethearchaeota archaeon]
MSKYYHFYSKGYIEFNLENILTKKDEKEFFTLYRLIHASRFKSFKKGKCLLDLFLEQSNEEGIKIGKNLRETVHKVLELLGNELIHQNQTLLESINDDLIKPEDFYHELLQILYRIIFILYAEKRGMLPDASSLYYKQFSISSIRELAEKPIKIDKNVDLWQKLFILFKIMKEGNKFLGVNAFNGKLFDDENLQIINTYKPKISNDSFLKIIRELTTVKIGNARQRINFLEVSVEEIGSIYESLLDYQPKFDKNNFILFLSDDKRKSSGSYYTNKKIVRLIVEKTIIPYVKSKKLKKNISKDEKVKRLLDIKICDPACGGGSFLIAALDTLGKILAQIKSNQEIPPDSILESSRREVLENCIYGVDLNPFATELTKLSLWIHACVKDKPLNFLDHHIKTGNSIISIFIKDIFKEITKTSRQSTLFDYYFNQIKEFREEFLKLQNIRENDIKNVIKKEMIFKKIIKSEKYRIAKRIADLYLYLIIKNNKKPENFENYINCILNQNIKNLKKADLLDFEKNGKDII